MVLSEVVLAVLFSLSGMILAILLGSLGTKYVGRLTPISIVVFGVLLPIMFSFLFLQLMQYVTILDWPRGGGRFVAISPLTAIFVAAWFGGFLGLYAGKIWGEENDKSCLQCVLLPISLVLVGILIVALFL